MARQNRRLRFGIPFTIQFAMTSCSSPPTPEICRYAPSMEFCNSFNPSTVTIVKFATSEQMFKIVPSRLVSLLPRGTQFRPALPTANSMAESVSGGGSLYAVRFPSASNYTIYASPQGLGWFAVSNGIDLTKSNI